MSVPQPISEPSSTIFDSSRLPTSSFITVPEVHNFRSVGIHRVASSSASLGPSSSNDLQARKRTRADFIYRCADPSTITPEGTSKLHHLGIRTIFDLRSAPECEARPYSIPGIARVFAPVYVDHDTSPAALARRMANYADEGSAGFVRAYAEILGAGRDAYRTVFRHVLERPRDSFVVHCTAGKDRTGVVVALALQVVGVADAEVAEEYALSEAGLAEWMEGFVRMLVSKGEWGGDEGKVRRALGARREVMVEFLGMLREEWGGAEGYLRKGLGFSAEEVERIRANLIENAE